MTISFVLTSANQAFISNYLLRAGMNKTQIMNNALDLYRKLALQKDLMEGFAEQSDEEVGEAMSDFDDYLVNIDHE